MHVCMDKHSPAHKSLGVTRLLVTRLRQTLPIGNPPVTSAGLLHPMLLAAKTLKANSSQFCTTPSRGVLWIKVTGAAVVEVDVAFMVELISSSVIVAEPDVIVAEPVTVAEPVSADVVLRDFITSLLTAAESVSVNVTFTVEFISSPVILLWT